MPDRDLETKAWTWGPPVAFAAAFAILWFGGLNEAVFHRVNSWSTVTGPEVWGGITVFGDALILLALALPILWYRPQWAWGLLAAALVTTAVTHTLKPWLDMPRPVAVLGADAITVVGPELLRKAMPSGHASAVMTVVGGLVAVTRSRSVRITLLVFGLLVAVSRVVVGAHWPVDVLAGAVIGWLSGVVAMRIVGDRAWMHGRVAMIVLSVALAGCTIALLFTRIDYPGAYPVQLGVAVLSVGLAGWLALRSREPMTDA